MLSTTEPATGTHAISHPRTPGRARRLLSTAVLTVAGLGLTATGAFASWQAVTTQSPLQISAATSAATGTDAATAALVDAGGGSFATGVADLAPGDYFYRYVDVRNDGRAPATFTGTVSADGALAGHLAVEATSCTLPWDTTGGASTCADPAPIGSGVPTAGAPVPVTHGDIATGDAQVQHVRYRFTFSPTAPDRLQGQTGSVSFAVGPATDR
ncbi:hypothetical protein [uncultured Pseudokineococcus sp.]|uniref:hypothetical protein n=1 Tax=uncultured Pseudokineococcus sp. TaxID=1642928 RepID=UPI00262FD019|nr:hypothetical protein [uncultured Pseudokineococcus sp.]